MNDTTEKIRGRLFGGFDRRDVVDYISRLADERNQAIEERDQLFDRVEQLEKELAALTDEPGDDPEEVNPEDDPEEDPEAEETDPEELEAQEPDSEEPLPKVPAKAPASAANAIPDETLRALFTELFQNLKGDAIQETDATIGSLEDQFAAMKTDIEVTAAHMRCELKKMNDYLCSVTEAFDNTEKKIGELRKSVSGELPAEEKRHH